MRRNKIERGRAITAMDEMELESYWRTHLNRHRAMLRLEADLAAAPLPVVNKPDIAPRIADALAEGHEEQDGERWDGLS